MNDDGTSGQDRESYTDTQDRDSYTVEGVLCRYCGLPSPDEANICEVCFEDRQRYGSIGEDGLWIPDVVIYEVGGSIRDELLGLTNKDKDFSVEAPSFERMKEFLEWRGYTIFVETPEFLTIRAHFPKEHPEFGKTTADFVLCRKDGAYSDGRRPDEVIPGTILDDLARRDFTCNAIARKVGTSEILDPWNGVEAARNKQLIAVGNAADRLIEDSLRGLRAIRFHITKGFSWDYDLARAMESLWLPARLAQVSAERKREEMLKCFRHDTNATLEILSQRNLRQLRDAIFTDGLWLRPTLEDK